MSVSVWYQPKRVVYCLIPYWAWYHTELAFLTADFPTIFGHWVMPLWPTFESLRTTKHNFSIIGCLYNGKFTVKTSKSRSLFMLSELSRIFRESRQFRKNGRFWPSWEKLIKKAGWLVLPIPTVCDLVWGVWHLLVIQLMCATQTNIYLFSFAN